MPPERLGDEGDLNVASSGKFSSDRTIANTPPKLGRKILPVA